METIENEIVQPCLLYGYLHGWSPTDNVWTASINYFRWTKRSVPKHGGRPRVFCPDKALSLDLGGSGRLTPKIQRKPDGYREEFATVNNASLSRVQKLLDRFVFTETATLGKRKKTSLVLSTESGQSDFWPTPVYATIQIVLPAHTYTHIHQCM